MQWPEVPCEACPRVSRGLEGTCYSQESKHKRFCDLARSGDHRYDPFLCDEPPKPQEFPPLLEQLGNAAKAAVRFVGSGFEVASDELQRERLSICSECPNFVEKRCALCGCTLMLKVASKAEYCPDKPPRW